MATSALATMKTFAGSTPTGKAATALLAGAAVLGATALWNNATLRRISHDL